MALATATALTALAGLAAASTGYSIYAGEQGRKQQKAALRQQEAAQRQAEARALSQQRSSEQAMAAANRKRPDVNAILAAAQEASKTGSASTMLTGPRGANGTSSLGRTSLLGE